MLRSEESSSTGERTGARSPSCWQREPQCLGLRVELQDGHAFVFPYIHLSHAELKSGDEGDELHIAFASHTVEAKGHHLAKILAALQKQAVEWMKPVPSPVGQFLNEEGGPWIDSLEVTQTGVDGSGHGYRQTPLPSSSDFGLDGNLGGIAS